MCKWTPWTKHNAAHNVCQACGCGHSVCFTPKCYEIWQVISFLSILEKIYKVEDLSPVVSKPNMIYLIVHAFVDD